MPKRKVVRIDLNVVKPLIKQKCRSNVVFCEMMGRENQPTWVTDWGRKPTPKNLPSPEEAARMCAILQVEPEEILLEQSDIELVRGLIEAEKSNQSITHEGAHEIGFDDFTYAMHNETKNLSQESKDRLLQMARFFVEEEKRKKGQS